MPEIINFADAVTVALQLRRFGESHVGSIVEYANGVGVQYQVNDAQAGDDGQSLMAIEIIAKARVRRRQRTRLAAAGWEPPQGATMPNWWHLVGSPHEARKVAGDLSTLLTTVFSVSDAEVADSAAMNQ